MAQVPPTIIKLTMTRILDIHSNELIHNPLIGIRGMRPSVLSPQCCFRRKDLAVNVAAEMLHVPGMTQVFRVWAHAKDLDRVQ